MRIEQWHADKIANDAEYAEAVRLIQLNEDIADLVVRMRIKAGVSQSDLARRAGTTQAVISRLENAEGNPTSELISRIMLALIEAHAPAVPAAAPPAEPDDLLVAVTPAGEVFPGLTGRVWRPLPAEQPDSFASAA